MALKQCLSTAAIETALERLPKDLEETYERVLHNIPEELYPEANATLQWVAFAFEELSLGKAAEAAIFLPATFPLQLNGSEKVEQVPRERLLRPSMVLEVCPGLIVCSEDSEGKHSLALARFSVLEYLLSDRICRGCVRRHAFSEDEAHKLIGERCLSYLTILDRPGMMSWLTESMDLRGPSIGWDEHDDWKKRTLSDSRLISYPLLVYSAVHWSEHVTAAQHAHAKTMVSLDHISAILDARQGPCFLNWRETYLRWSKLLMVDHPELQDILEDPVDYKFLLRHRRTC